MQPLRTVAAIVALGGLLAALPASATAGGTGRECPSGLKQKLVAANYQGGVRYRYALLKISGYEPRVYHTEKTEGMDKARLNYVWGEGGRISVKPNTWFCAESRFRW